MPANLILRASFVMLIAAAGFATARAHGNPSDASMADTTQAFARQPDLPIFAMAAAGSEFLTVGLSVPYMPLTRVPADEPIVDLSPKPKYASPAGLFGSVDISISGSVHAKKWSALLSESASRYFDEECDGPATVCASSARQTILRAVKASRNAIGRERLEIVNSAVNKAIRWVSDDAHYGLSDYWATAAETLSSGKGDCEDIAIVKYWALQAAGVPAHAIRLVLIKERTRKVDHAILAVKLDEENLILDNLKRDVTSDTNLKAYAPLISFAKNGSWIHGISRKPVQVASSRMN